jgi:dTDP-4-amino-4,6-dideoxygalactose transaminase
MMAVPFFDHTIMHKALQVELTNALMNVLSGESLILGREVKGFEQEFSTYLSCRYAAGVNSGLDALILSLRAIDVQEGDEVIVPANTYFATWHAVHLIGAVPVPVDPDPVTMNISTDKIITKITSRTKAIMPVHLYGLPCPMDEIMKIAEVYSLSVIEDNAQAVGSSFTGKKTGSWGHINASSFYPTKNLGALGDGGMVTSHNEELITRVRSLRNYGTSKRYVSDETGLNSRLDELQAAFLRIKLKKLDEWISERKLIASQYVNALKDIDQITLPVDSDDHTYHLFVIRCNERDALAAYLQEREISTLIHYPIPPHLQKAYSYLGCREGDFPITESIAKTCLSLPLYYGFRQIEEVVDCIRGFYKK